MRTYFTMEANAGDTVQVKIRCWQCGSWMKFGGEDQEEWLFSCPLCLDKNQMHLTVGVIFERECNPIN